MALGVNAFIGIYLLRNRGRDAVARAVAGCAAAVCVWCFAGTLASATGERETWARVGMLGTAMAPASFLLASILFVWARAQRGPLSPKHHWLYLLYVPVLLGYCLLDTQSLAVGCSHESWSWRHEPYPADSVTARLAFIYIAAFAIASLIPLARAGRLLRDPDDRRAASLLTFAVALPMTVLILITPATSSHADAFPTPGLLLVAGAGGLILVFLATGVVTVKVAPNRTVHFLVSVVFIAHATIVSALILARAFKAQFGVSHVLLLVACSIFVSFLYGAFRNHLQEAIDRLFFREHYQYQKMVEQFERDLRATQERLRRAERMSTIGELAASVAHEIKNPLGPIKGYVQLLEGRLAQSADLADDPLCSKAIRIITEEIEKIDACVRRLMGVAEPKPMVSSRCDLNELAEKALLLVSHEESCHESIYVRKALSPDPVIVTGNPDRLQGAIFNVLVNAVEAMPDGGTLGISTHQSEGASSVVVSDTGQGIPEDVLSKVFDPFFTTKETGAGLGLGIVKKALEAHAGSVAVESRDGEGTTITLTIETQA